MLHHSRANIISVMIAVNRIIKLNIRDLISFTICPRARMEYAVLFMHEKTAKTNSITTLPRLPIKKKNCAIGAQ